MEPAAEIRICYGNKHTYPAATAKSKLHKTKDGRWLVDFVLTISGRHVNLPYRKVKKIHLKDIELGENEGYLKLVYLALKEHFEESKKICTS